MEHDGNIVLDLHKLKRFLRKRKRRSLDPRTAKGERRRFSTEVEDNSTSREFCRTTSNALYCCCNFMVYAFGLVFQFLLLGLIFMNDYSTSVSRSFERPSLGETRGDGRHGQVLLNWGYHTDCSDDGFDCFMTEVSSMLTERVQYAAWWTKLGCVAADESSDVFLGFSWTSIRCIRCTNGH